MGEYVGLKKKKQERLGKKPREATKQIETTRDLLTNYVNVIKSCEGVVDYYSEKPVAPNLRHKTFFDLKLPSTIPVLPIYSRTYVIVDHPQEEPKVTHIVRGRGLLESIYLCQSNVNALSINVVSQIVH